MYDLLPTIRSRSVIITLAPLSNQEMRDFAKAHNLEDAEKRIALSGGSPGNALSLDIAAYEKRREAMHTLLKAAAGMIGFSAWMPFSEAIGRSKNEKLEIHVTMLYGLLRDLLILRESGGDIRNSDLRGELTALANHVSTRWIIAAAKKTGRDRRVVEAQYSEMYCVGRSDRGVEDTKLTARSANRGMMRGSPGICIATRSHHNLIVTVLTSVYCCNPYSPSSRPIPDCLKPPNGAAASNTS